MRFHHRFDWSIPAVWRRESRIWRRIGGVFVKRVFSKEIITVLVGENGIV